MFVGGSACVRACVPMHCKQDGWCRYVHSSTGIKLDGPGGYAFSEVDNILNWTWALQPGQTVYGWNVSVSDGSSLQLHSRQRPKLLLDTDGRPSVLYNGVSVGGQCHTFAQRVKRFVRVPQHHNLIS